jgi:hypothetical protein
MKKCYGRRKMCLAFDGFKRFLFPEYDRVVFCMPSVCLYAYMHVWMDVRLNSISAAGRILFMFCV